MAAIGRKKGPGLNRFWCLDPDDEQSPMWVDTQEGITIFHRLLRQYDYPWAFVFDTQNPGESPAGIILKDDEPQIRFFKY